MSDRKRGFAAMDPEKQRLIASKGGRAAHAKGTAHQFTPEEARAAGRKGGQAAHAKGTAHEFTPEEAREAGRKGGQSSHGRQDRPAEQGPDEFRTGQGQPLASAEVVATAAPQGGNQPFVGQQRSSEGQPLNQGM